MPGCHEIVSEPPGMMTFTGDVARLAMIAATAVAQAPVPQARVRPAPRSQVFRKMSLPAICATLTLIRSGNAASCSMRGPELIEVDVEPIVDEEYEMRVANVERHGVLERVPRHWQAGRVHWVGERDLIPAEARLADADLDLGSDAAALKQAAVALDRLCAGELDDTAGRISAAFDFTAVAVPDPHPEVGAVAGLEHDQLVAADASVPVCNRTRERLRDLERVFASVDDHEIIAETVHLVEVALHRARDLGSVHSLVHLRGQNAKSRQ